jgi:Holliday junction resolvase-like predicted endonuclease
MTTVLKADHTRELFSEEKVLSSIKRAGIPKNLQTEVLDHIKSKLYEGISTAEIYEHITEYLLKSPQPYAKSRYSLKQAIMSLGPTGYPFEDFVAKLLQTEGYHTKVRQVLNGECITHEIDIIAERAGKAAAIEAKFHNSPGTRSQVQVALYTQARFEDIKLRNHIDETWLITNTKTTVDVNTYALCKKIRVISWSYPEGDSLRDMIERSGLHPVTTLTSLSEAQKRILLNNHIVLCKEICEDNSLIDMLYLQNHQIEKVLTEVQYICKREESL